MGVLVIVAYRPKAGKAEMLLELTKRHTPILQGLGLATDRPAYAMRAADSTIASKSYRMEVEKGGDRGGSLTNPERFC